MHLEAADSLPQVRDIVDQTEDHEEEDTADDTEGHYDDQLKVIVSITSLTACISLLQSLYWIV